jgi:hypothetical protein
MQNIAAEHIWLPDDRQHAAADPAILAGLVDDVADHVDTLLRSVRESGY